jgi:hypothetical protein
MRSVFCSTLLAGALALGPAAAAQSLQDAGANPQGLADLVAKLKAYGDSVANRPVPRMPDGKPDLSGIYNKLVRDIFDGAKPTPEFTPAGKAKWDNVANEIDPVNQCNWPGVPRLMQEPDPFEIEQKDGKVIFLYEYMHNFRVVPTDGRPHPKEIPLSRAWLGDSVGHWEGDTLVIDTVGLNNLTRLDPQGHPKSDQAHIIEKYRRPRYDQLWYEVTVDDPKYYKHPFSQSATFQLAPPDWRIEEYACNENNQDAWVKGAH